MKRLIILKATLACLAVFNVSIIASAQYSFRISLGVKCQGLNGDYLAKQINDALAAQHNADMFSSLAECESARNAINKNYTTQGCSVSINVSPCVGNGTAGAAGATGSSGSIYKGQSSFYSSNASNEVKDWAQDNDEFFKIIGGTGTESVPAQTVKTGDEGYDKMMQNDLETIEQKQDDRPGFDDGFFVGRTFKSLGSDWSSPDFKSPPKVPPLPEISKESTTIDYSPESQDYSDGDEGHESFGKRAVNYVSEKLENHDGLKQAWEVATETCTTMAETAIENTSTVAKKVVGVVSTVGSVLNFKKFMTKYTTDLTNETLDGISTSVRTGRPPRKIISDELRERPEKEARKMIIKGGAKAGYKDLWNGRVL